jgi:mannose-1-phosphate guanylyltransferase
MARQDSAAMQNEHTWVLVLAAGEGRRLQELTTTASGIVIPKQYCSLLGGPSLLQEALRRGEAIAPRGRVCTVVADQHRRWWPKHTQSVPDNNVIVQPMNRGTANGILLPLLQILRRDPDARIVLLPSDHYFDDELELAHWLRVASAPSEAAEILLLGFEPRSADPQLGYIVPGHLIGSRRWAVGAFVEKPPLTRASELVRAGALWNAFIIAADARALLALYERHCGDLLRRMREAVDRVANRDGTALKVLYEELPDIDFCRDLLENTGQPLRVLAVPQCGWSDLGTPERVAEVLLGGTTARASRRQRAHGSSLSLAAQHGRQASEARWSAG